MSKKLLFSLSGKDFEFQTFCSGGKGGQNQNKRETGVRIIHTASGARGESREYREQVRNKRAAFERLAKSKEFLAWHKAECARRMGQSVDIDKIVNEAMTEKNLKIEYYSS